MRTWNSKQPGLNGCLFISNHFPYKDFFQHPFFFPNHFCFRVPGFDGYPKNQPTNGDSSVEPRFRVLKLYQRCHGWFLFPSGSHGPKGSWWEVWDGATINQRYCRCCYVCCFLESMPYAWTFMKNELLLHTWSIVILNPSIWFSVPVDRKSSNYRTIFQRDL